VIRRADGAERQPGARPNRSSLSVGLALLVLVAFVIADRREHPADVSALRTSADATLSLAAGAGPDDTVRSLPVAEIPITSAAPTDRPPAPTSAAPSGSAHPRTAPEPVTTPDGTVPTSPAAESTAPAPPVVADAADGGPAPSTTAETAVAPVEPVLVARPIPDPPQILPLAPPPPWAGSTRTASNGLVATDVGCASGTSAGALDAFFRERVGPILGLDYQHVYALGGSRSLWLFQDTFVDHSGTAVRLDEAAFVHNTAMVQDGACFTVYHRGSTTAPASFEPGTGERKLAKWFWPMGGELSDGQLFVFWAEMEKDGYEPGPSDGLGWHPKRTWLAVYDPTTLTRLAFQPAPAAGVYPIYGYAVASAGEYTYLFGNTFEQNLAREGGFRNGPHSATAMYLARVPRGQYGSVPEYRAGDGWTAEPDLAQPVVERYWAENPMQPRYLGGQWVAATKVDGYWGERLAVDVADNPWGPWTTVSLRTLSPRNGDPLMNTYHAHLMPWVDGGQLVVSISQNARNMRRDAWPSPSRYRLAFSNAVLVAPPADAPPPEETTTSEPGTTVPETTTGGTAPTTTTPTATTGQKPCTAPRPNSAAAMAV
jgi:hypothetical protein